MRKEHQAAVRESSLSIDWPPIIDPIPVLDADVLQTAIDRTKQQLDAGVIPGGDVFYGLDEDLVELVIALDMNACDEPHLAQFAVLNALGDTLGLLLPPIVPVTFDANGSVMIDGSRSGRVDVHYLSDQGTDVGLVLTSLALSGSDSAIDALTGTKIDLITFLENYSRHMLVWLARLQDSKGRAVSEAFTVRLHERLSDPQACLGRDGQLRKP